MARLHVEEEREDSDSLPELLSVLNLSSDTVKSKTAAAAYSKRESSKVTTTPAITADPPLAEAPRHHHKQSLLSSEGEPLENNRIGEDVSRRHLVTIPDNNNLPGQGISQSRTSLTRQTGRRSRLQCSKFIAFAEEHESSGSEEESPGSLLDFVVDDDYISYESEIEQENGKPLYEGRHGHGDTKTEEKSLGGRGRNPREQSRKPLVLIPDNPIAAREKTRISREPQVQISSQRRRANYIPSEAEDEVYGSEDDSAGSLVDFVVDDDYISYESEGEEEKSHILCAGRDCHIASEADRKPLDAREKRPSDSPTIGVEERWIDENSSDAGASDPAVSDGPGGSFKNVPAAILDFSQRVYEPPVLPSTSTPYISLLSSPTSNEFNPDTPRKLLRIPTPPPRPSEDTFWSSNLINKWNDQHSPRKTPKSKAFSMPNTTHDNHHVAVTQPTSCLRTPLKKTREEFEARRLFDRKKDGIARAFLTELDDKVASGRISKLTASTGGVQIVWNKTLRTTAGKASVVRRSRVQRDGHPSETLTGSIEATIQLSEKVLDNEERLIDTLAHEWSHLAHIMISHRVGTSHGKEFKAWLQKAAEAFPDRVITVSAKHFYDIDYKYIWECVNCSRLIKRHSNSIDTAKRVCKRCLGMLIQIKPTARLVPPSRWQFYLKKHFREFKKAHPGKSHREVMKLLGTAYKDVQRAAETGDTQEAARPLPVFNDMPIWISDDEEDGAPRNSEAKVVDNDSDDGDDSDDGYRGENDIVEESDVDENHDEDADTDISENENGEEIEDAEREGIKDAPQEDDDENEDDTLEASQPSSPIPKYRKTPKSYGHRQRRNAIVNVLPKSMM